MRLIIDIEEPTAQLVRLKLSGESAKSESVAVGRAADFLLAEVGQSVRKMRWKGIYVEEVSIGEFKVKG